MSTCYLPETMPDRNNGEQSKFGPCHQEVCSPVRELAIGQLILEINGQFKTGKCHEEML